ncbi:MAG: hypothetical protein GY828_01695 [Candidatus Gracilibacteria bacterium]|nr:hypothetical protein [Candidatus Gracilibacteria bacterium]
MNQKVITNNLRNNFSSHRKIEKDKLQNGLQTTYIIMLTFISILLLYYVWILNVNATKGDEIRKIKIELDQLILEKKDLDVIIADLESIKTIGNDDEYMEKSEKPEFLVIKEGVNYVYNY